MLSCAVVDLLNYGVVYVWDCGYAKLFSGRVVDLCRCYIVYLLVCICVYLCSCVFFGVM